MRLEMATLAGSPDKPSEDWVSASPNLVVVLDGQTARTDTGCSHGVAWFAAHLGAAVLVSASSPDTSLVEALASAIEATARQHPECDLNDPATPGAAVGIVRLGRRLDYLVLGDVTLVLDEGKHVQVIIDDRVGQTAVPERRYVDRFPIGAPEKAEGLIRMKRAELAARNREGGFWVAAADPGAAAHALTGSVSLRRLRRLAVLTDGAARIVTPFGALSWPQLLDALDTAGPAAVIDQVGVIEAADPVATRWPRNKRSDDASAVLTAFHRPTLARVRTKPSSTPRRARKRRPC